MNGQYLSQVLQQWPSNTSQKSSKWLPKTNCKQQDFSDSLRRCHHLNKTPSEDNAKSAKFKQLTDTTPKELQIELTKMISQLANTTTLALSLGKTIFTTSCKFSRQLVLNSANSATLLSRGQGSNCPNVKKMCLSLAAACWVCVELSTCWSKVGK